MLIDVWHLPHHDLARGGGEFGWTVTGSDPFFVVPLGDPGLSPGHYNLIFDFDDADAVFSTVKIYRDDGQGFNEAQAANYASFRIDDCRRVVPMSFEAPVRALRIDPDLPMDRVFRLRAITIRKTDRIRWYGSQVVREVAQLRSHPRLLLMGLRRAAGHFRAGGFRQVARVIRDRSVKGQAGLVNVSEADAYRLWISLNETDDPAPPRAMAGGPLISIVMPTYNTPGKLLRECVDSVIAQTYPNWELCIADDASSAVETTSTLKALAAQDSRIRVVFRPENGHISAATNSAFELCRGEWVALLDHDDLLAKNALAEVAAAIKAHPQAQLIYSDEDKIDMGGRRFSPFFKPAFSLELFRSANYLNHLTVHRADNIRRVGGWRAGFEGSQDYDLNLRVIETVPIESIVHIPKVLYHWRAVEGSTALAGSEKNYPYEAGLRALKEHLERTGEQADVEPATGLPYYRIRPRLPEPQPLVSIIIPTKDGVELLRGCLNSIFSGTSYRNYEIIIVNNQSVEPQTAEYFDELRDDARVRIIDYDKPFNYSAINNTAVQQANGSVICLLNNDIVAISPSWLDEMVSWAIQNRVGCVGAKLYYGNETLQHCGVILGVGGVAGHSHKHRPRYDTGYFSRTALLQNLSAVTAACLVVRKEVYDVVGGLNERDLKVAFNDVDFCLRVRQAGFVNVWTPYAELYHLESVSRGAEDNPEKIARFNREITYMRDYWGDLLTRDPYYSPHLTLVHEDFSFNTTRAVAQSDVASRTPFVIRPAKAARP